MFATYENLQGEPMTGLLRIEGGAKILKERRASVPRRLDGSIRETDHFDLIEQEIAPVIELLEDKLINISLRFTTSTTSVEYWDDV
jgi:hypothetical protein